jgi:hypothetical protein
MVAPTVGSGGVCVWWDSAVWSQAVSFVFVCLEGIWLQGPTRCFRILFSL